MECSVCGANKGPLYRFRFIDNDKVYCWFCSVKWNGGHEMEEVEE